VSHKPLAEMVESMAQASEASPGDGLHHSGRFAAFSFVDRITLIEGTTRVCGLYTIPVDVSRFPVSLVAEAIGQLAAWVAMSAVDFSHRPVAALAGDTRMHHLPRAGDTLELIVDIESCDAESIQYRGRALIAGQLVLELSDTLGSMLEISEFDAPEALRADFFLLTTSGRAPGAFKGVPLPVFEDIPPALEQRCEAKLFVPAQADFFLDHFPRRPVFPATLMIDAQLQLAQRLAEMQAGGPVRIQRITNVKVRAFTAPGATLVLFAERAEPSPTDVEPILIKVGAQTEGRTIAGAKMFFVPDSGETA
jgi:3-hydroxymyristoyl/3-hydroxydecanoyl-(acyl carrier protein) dehydratase